MTVDSREIVVVRKNSIRLPSDRDAGTYLFVWVANSASALNFELLRSDTILSMRDIFILLLHAIVIIVRLGRPAGLRSVVAESVLLRHQVLILNRGRKRAPNLRTPDRIIAGLCTPADASGTCFAVGRGLEALDSAAISQNADEAEVRSAVFTQTSPTARSKGTEQRANRGGR